MTNQPSGIIGDAEDGTHPLDHLFIVWYFNAWVFWKSVIMALSVDSA